MKGDRIADDHIRLPLHQSVHAFLKAFLLAQFEAAIIARQDGADRRDQIDQRCKADNPDPRCLRRLLIDKGEGALNRGFDLDHLDIERLADKASRSAAADDDLCPFIQRLLGRLHPLMQIAQIGLGRIVGCVVMMLCALMRICSNGAINAITIDLISPLVGQKYADR